MMRICRTWVVTLLLASGLTLSAQPKLADKVGFYQWVGVSDQQGDLLTQARERTTTLGSRVFRFYLGCRYDYINPVVAPRRFDQSATLSPTAILSTVDYYRAVLDDPALETIILTVYSCANYGGGPDDINLQRPWSDRESLMVGDQIGDLADWLYEHYGEQRKTIILANNETDEKLHDIADYSGSMDMAVTNLRSWLTTRQQAITAARQRHPDANLRLFHAVELSLVNLALRESDGVFHKSSRHGVNALSHILPEIKFDLVSYSSYESTNSPYETQNPDTPPTETKGRLQRDLNQIRERTQASLTEAGRAAFGDRFVMIGELGFSRDRFEHLPTGGLKPRLKSALSAALDWGCPYIVLWQVFDAPRQGGAAWGFGMYDGTGSTPEIAAEPSTCNSVRDCIEMLYDDGIEAW